MRIKDALEIFHMRIIYKKFFDIFLETPASSHLLSLLRVEADWKMLQLQLSHRVLQELLNGHSKDDSAVTFFSSVLVNIDALLQSQICKTLIR